ncbi:hypothetical protein ACQKGJ_20685 [Pedobacter suwonensis]
MKNRRLPLLSGLGTKVGALQTLKMKYCPCHIAPVEAVTLQQWGTRQRSVKAENGTNLVICTGPALQIEK